MIVYVESNFVLEVALGQEESSSAATILQFAEDGKIELAFPGFALGEPFATITHRGRERRRLCNSLTDQLRQLQRSEPHKQVVANLQSAPIILAAVERREIDLLESTIKSMLAVGKAIELNTAIFDLALIYQHRYGQSPQDSIIYSAVIDDLKRQDPDEAKCFISQNWKDFGDPGLIAELRTHNCHYVESFVEGLKLLPDGLP